MSTMTSAAFGTKVFDRFYSYAEVAAIPKRERMQYEESLKRYRDILMDKETTRNAKKRAREE